MRSKITTSEARSERDDHWGVHDANLAQLETLDLLHDLLEVLELLEKLVNFLHRPSRSASDAHDARLRVLGQHLRVVQLCTHIPL
jgi:hypothetical protein